MKSKYTSKSFKENQEKNAFCPNCNELMKRSVEKRDWFDKLFNLPISDRYDCPKCGDGPY